MSADNGYIIRKNKDGKFVLQMYFASNDYLPPITADTADVFDTLEEAVEYYTVKQFQPEYGLKIYKSCYPQKEINMQTTKFVRKQFSIDAVQLTDDNFTTVANWCGGEITEDSKGAQYIKVNVQNPLTARQTKAFVGDWVLASRRGFKVYTDLAFKKNFVKSAPVDNEVKTFNVFESSENTDQGSRDGNYFDESRTSKLYDQA